MLRTVGTIVVFTSDMARARRFYGGVLGLPLSVDTPHWVEIETEGVPLALHAGVAPRAPGEPPPEARPHVQVSFEVESVAAAHAALLARGVPFTRPPVEIAPGRHVANFRDPDGNDLSIAGPA